MVLLSSDKLELKKVNAVVAVGQRVFLDEDTERELAGTGSELCELLAQDAAIASI